MLHASRAYAASAKSALSGRRLLAAVLSQCATDMQRVIDLQQTDSPSDVLVEVLERNRRAWSAIAEELSDPESPLDPAVKASLARFAAFIFRETCAICEAPAAERLSPLIEVNRLLASGFEPKPA